MKTSTGKSRNKKTGMIKILDAVTVRHVRTVTPTPEPLALQFQLSINTDGDAFSPSPFPELARILRNVADGLEYGVHAPDVPLYIRVRDANGNACAFVFYKPDTDADGERGTL